MKFNKWTLSLAALGVVSLASAAKADEHEGNAVQTALSSTTISGYVNTSAWWNLGAGNGNTPAFGNSAGKQDGFNLDVVKLSLEKPMDESEWASGYKVDLLFGPDANALGTASAPLSVGSADFAIKQAYVALRTPVGNGIDWKVGVWDTIIGYETFDAGNNPNYTRSWGYTIEPTTHTGVLASYRFSDMFSASVGVANTFGPVINGRTTNQGSTRETESYKTYMASFALTAPDDWGFLAGSTFYGGVINGFNAAGITDWNQTSWYAGATIATPVEGLRLGAAFDYVNVHSDSSFDGTAKAGSSAYAYAIALYASFQATEKMSLHARAERFQRSFDPTLSTFTGGVAPVLGGLPKEAYALTGTLQYDLWENVLSRLEVRWDNAAGGTDVFGGNTAIAAGGSARSRDSVAIIANLIYKF